MVHVPWSSVPFTIWKKERQKRVESMSEPIPSMYGIFTYIWLISMVNVGKYTIHGWYGVCQAMYNNKKARSLNAIGTSIKRVFGIIRVFLEIEYILHDLQYQKNVEVI